MFILNNGRNTCCGCEACSAVCSHNAISMVEDTEGFLYPTINSEICMNCGLCEKTYTFSYAQNNKDRFYNRLRHTYAVKHNNIDIRMNSCSGGIFTAISDLILSWGMVIYGASLNVKNVQLVVYRLRGVA